MGNSAYEVNVGLNYRVNENLFVRVFNARRLSEYNGLTANNITQRRQNHYRAAVTYTF